MQPLNDADAAAAAAADAALVRSFREMLLWSLNSLKGFAGKNRGSMRNSYQRWSSGEAVPRSERAGTTAGKVWTEVLALEAEETREEFFTSLQTWFPEAQQFWTAKKFGESVEKRFQGFWNRRNAGKRQSSAAGHPEPKPGYPPVAPSALSVSDAKWSRDGATSSERRSPLIPWLVIPRVEWDSNRHGPSSLLCAEFRIVKFHGSGRMAEVADLKRWCSGSERISFRLYTGAGGIGKTRMALQLCDELKASEQSKWTVGFMNERSLCTDRSPWAEMRLRDRPLLVVVDYAADQTKTEKTLHLLRNLNSCPASQIRILFLEREHLWLGRLFEDSDARKALDKACFERDQLDIRLPPVAASVADRKNSYQLAATEFAAKLKVVAGGATELDLSAAAYDQVLLLHTQALLRTSGVKVADRTSAILNGLLARERKYWKRLASARGLDWSLLPAIEQACYAISSAGGVESVEAGVVLCLEHTFLSDLPRVVLFGIVDLLRECYPTDGVGIGPLQPDLLAQQLGGRAVRQSLKGST